MNKLVSVYISNVVFSIGIIASILLFYAEDYSKLTHTNFYYFYWLVSLLSFTFGFLEVFFHIIVQRVFLGFTSIFFSLSWIISSILSSLILNECLMEYENCNTIISLTVFALLQTIVWGISIYLTWFVYRKNDILDISSDTSNESYESYESHSSIDSNHQPVMQQVHRQTIVCSPASAVSQHPEIIDLDMEEIRL